MICGYHLSMTAAVLDRFTGPDDLRAWRTSMGLSQPELADRLGVSKYTVNRWECRRRPPSPEMRYAIRDLTGADGSDQVISPDSWGPVPEPDLEAPEGGRVRINLSVDPDVADALHRAAVADGSPLARWVAEVAVRVAKRRLAKVA